MYRFQSLATEPGLIGTLCGFLIYIVSDIKEYKFANLIFWISGILSFSLAFYVIVSLKLLSQFNLKMILLIVSFFTVAFLLIPNFFQEHIVARVSGEEHGDNRSSVELDMKLKQSYNDDTLWFGNGYRSYDKFVTKGVAGAKPWIYQYGIISVFLLFLSYVEYFVHNSLKLGLV